IEDNPSNRELMAMMIEHIDSVTLYCAVDGESGLLLAESLQPDIIIVDIDLPGMDGYSVRRSLVATPENRDTPIFALSAAASINDRHRGREAGFTRYLTKPIQFSEIEDIIRETVKN
ncbi:MAG: response regulator, partial [Mariprofundales bacterium]|nr:response regulator [Mariprofundales bacterium]